MRLRKSLLATVLVSAVAAVGASAFVGVQAATAADQKGALRKKECVSRVLVEHMNVWYTNMPPAEEVPIGFHSLGFDDILDTSGKVVATAAYSMDVVERTPNGHLIAHLAEQVHFPEGAILFTGTFDRTAMFEGAWAVQKVEGISGKYKGWRGTYTWKFQEELSNPDAPPDFDVKLFMCNR